LRIATKILRADHFLKRVSQTSCKPADCFSYKSSQYSSQSVRPLQAAIVLISPRMAMVSCPMYKKPTRVL